MSDHDLEKLLGGFAADTLTPEEKQALYTAALQDQQLFNALADEQALKELLSDPDVRRRLLTSLEQKRTSGADGSLSWLDWFRRPASLAFAGGLTAAALAVVLGIRIYQDSLRQAAQSVATEDARPASQPTPQAVEPKANAQENVAPAIGLPKKDTLIDKRTKREGPAPLKPEEQRPSNAARDAALQQSKQDETRGHANAPLAAFSKSEKGVTTQTDQKLLARSAPPATAPALAPGRAPTDSPVDGAVAPAVSARALFYAGELARPDRGRMALEKERAMKPLAESAPHANRLERKLEGLSQLGKAAGTAAQLRSLGLRYSFVVRGTDGQEREVDAATAKSTEPAHFTVEANQEAYLQIWITAGSSAPQLLWPEKATGQISLKMNAGQRQHIPLPLESGPVTLTARLSRSPFGPVTSQESTIFDRFSPNQLQESIITSNQTGSQEHATYVVNHDPSRTAQIAVDIALGR